MVYASKYGANDINNAKNITSLEVVNYGGDITSGGNINTAHEVIAHIGYGQ